MKTNRFKITVVLLCLQVAVFAAAALTLKETERITGFFVYLGLYLFVFILPVFVYLRLALRVKPCGYLMLHCSLKGILTGFAVSAFITLAFLIKNKFSFPVGALDLAALLNFTGLLLAGPLEEIPFRGFYLREFTEKWGFARANILTSVLFGLMHFRYFFTGEPLKILFFFGVSLWLGYIYEKTKSLWAPIIVHSTYNLLTAIFAANTP